MSWLRVWVIVYLCAHLRCVVGTKQDSSGSGRPAPLLQEPRFGAGPQPYRK
jgi:hypothetical protein